MRKNGPQITQILRGGVQLNAPTAPGEGGNRPRHVHGAMAAAGDGRKSTSLDQGEINGGVLIRRLSPVFKPTK